jgi:hypothetical protein
VVAGGLINRDEDGFATVVDPQVLGNTLMHDDLMGAMLGNGEASCLHGTNTQLQTGYGQIDSCVESLGLGGSGQSSGEPIVPLAPRALTASARSAWCQHAAAVYGFALDVLSIVSAQIVWQKLCSWVLHKNRPLVVGVLYGIALPVNLVQGLSWSQRCKRRTSNFLQLGLQCLT